MPFTFSHPAIILPLNYLPKRWISLTALVAGSIIPDFEYFITMKSGSVYSHTWLGLLWFDLPLALLLMWVYNSWVKNQLIDHLPAFFNKRLSPFRHPDGRYYMQRWAIIIISVLIGGASHLVWDSFTHWGGYFAMRIPFINSWVEVGDHGIPVFVILQLLSSVVGALVILIVICLLPAAKVSKAPHIFYYWFKIAAIALPIILIRFHHGLRRHEIENLIDTAISGTLIGLILISVITPVTKVAGDQ